MEIVREPENIEEADRLKQGQKKRLVDIKINAKLAVAVAADNDNMLDPIRTGLPVQDLTRGAVII